MKAYDTNQQPTPLPANLCESVSGGLDLASSLLPAPVHRVRRYLSRGWVPRPSPQPGIRSVGEG